MAVDRGPAGGTFDPGSSAGPVSSGGASVVATGGSVSGGVSTGGGSTGVVSSGGGDGGSSTTGGGGDVSTGGGEEGGVVTGGGDEGGVVTGGVTTGGGDEGGVVTGGGEVVTGGGDEGEGVTGGDEGESVPGADVDGTDVDGNADVDGITGPDVVRAGVALCPDAVAAAPGPVVDDGGATVAAATCAELDRIIAPAPARGPATVVRGRAVGWSSSGGPYGKISEKSPAERSSSVAGAPAAASAAPAAALGAGRAGAATRTGASSPPFDAGSARRKPARAPTKRTSAPSSDSTVAVHVLAFSPSGGRDSLTARPRPAARGTRLPRGQRHVPRSDGTAGSRAAGSTALRGSRTSAGGPRS